MPADHPESPVNKANLTNWERTQRTADISLSRHKVLHNPPSIQNASDFQDGKYTVPLTEQDYYFAAEIGIGMPPQKVYLALDTTAGLVWTQCKPCAFKNRGCYHQESPIYDPKKSASHAKFSCTDQLCPVNKGNLNNRYFKCHKNNSCTYSIYYGYHGLIKGMTERDASLESFTFTNGTKKDSVNLGVVFGCSHYSSEIPMFMNLENKITGILGLSLNPLSLYQQLFFKIGGKFSYFIGAYKSPLKALQTHNLRFGYKVIMPEKPIPSTPYILTGSDAYFLDLLDISVGPLRLMLPKGTFDAKKGRGMILGPASRLTVMRLDIYALLVGGLTAYYEALGNTIVPIKENPTLVQLCFFYDKPPIHPPLTFHFRGADFTVLLWFTTVVHLEELAFCVAMVPGLQGHFSRGAFHMQNMRINHDGYDRTIKFHSTDCGDDNA